MVIFNYFDYWNVLVVKWVGFDKFFLDLVIDFLVVLVYCNVVSDDSVY